MRKIYILGAMLLVITTTYAQNIELLEKKMYSSAKITFLDFNCAMVKNLELKEDSVYFLDPNTQRTNVVSINELNYIRVKGGTKIGQGALYGGVIMGLLCLNAVAQNNANPNVGVASNAGAITLGITAGGVFLGGLIGSAIPKWKTYYLNNKYSFWESVKPDVYVGRESLGISLKLGLN